jgi:hypothetical protein
MVRGVEMHILKKMNCANLIRRCLCVSETGKKAYDAVFKE